MEQKDRSVVLYAAVFGPVLGLRLTLSYLKVKRAARRAEKRFYHELVRSGLPKMEAKHLAGEYGSAISIRGVLSETGVAFPRNSRR
jgi:hypothetical protein